MESLMELVAASFARHGVECLNAHAALPDQSYRKTLQGDPAP